MRCWGRHAGELLVGAGTPAAPRLSECTSAVQSGCIVAGSRDPSNPNSVGRLQVGAPAPVPAPVSVGSGGQWDRATRAAASSWDRTVNGDVGGVVRDGVGCVTIPRACWTGRPTTTTPPAPSSSSSGGNQVQRATQAAGNSWNRVRQGDIGGVVQDGWNCVTNPARCWNGN